MFKQHLKIKNSVVDSNNCLNRVFSFDNFQKKLSSSFQLVDNFSDCFSFHSVTHKNKNAHIHNLDKIFEDFLSDPKTVIIISDASCYSTRVWTDFRVRVKR